MKNNWQFQFTFCRIEDELLCFINLDGYTDYLLPPSVTDWLQKGYLIRFAVKVVKQLDLTKLRRQYARGRSAVHHPIVLLNLLVYGYVTGIFSNRNKIALDSAKIKVNVNKYKTLSYGPTQKLESQLIEEVKTLIVRSEIADRKSIPDKMDVLIEIAKHEVRLVAIVQVKAKIEVRAVERFALEQREFEAKHVKRQAQRETGKKLRSEKIEPPQSSPNSKDQINLTDEESRIMPVSGGSFKQCYNAQATINTEPVLVISFFLTHAINNKEQVEPTFKKLAALPKVLGKSTYLLADTGYFSIQTSNSALSDGLNHYFAMKRESHHLKVFERFTPDTQAPEMANAVISRGHRLTTNANLRFFRAVYTAYIIRLASSRA